MTTNENPQDASKAERSSAGAGANRPASSMKERLLAERKAQGAEAPPVPAAKPAAAKPPAAKPAAAKPAAAAAPKAASSAPAPVRSAVAPAKPAAPKPAPARAKATRGDDAHIEHPDVKRELDLLRQRDSKTMMFAWIATGVLVVGALGTWGYVHNKTQGVEDARLAAEKLLLDLRQRAESFDVKTKQGATDFIAFMTKGELDGQKVDWQNNDYTSGPLTSRIGDAQRTLQREVDKEYFFEVLGRAESIANNAATKTPDEILQARRNIKTLEEKQDAYGDEAKKRVATCRVLIERVYVERLEQDAQAKAKDPAQLRAAMLSFGAAEDASVKLFEKQGIPDPTGELQKFGGEKMRLIYDASDAAAYQLFTPETIAKTEWTDCLSGDMKDNWFNDQLGGFEIQNGVMKIVGPEAGATKIGLAVVPKKSTWRDFQVEMEFELVKGSTDLYFRLYKRADAAVQGPRLAAGNEDGQIPPNRKVTFLATCVGSKLSYSYTGVELESATDAPIHWTKTRRGGFGLGVHPGCELKITKLRTRILRPE